MFYPPPMTAQLCPRCWTRWPMAAVCPGPCSPTRLCGRGCSRRSRSARIKPLIAITREQTPRPYDFKPSPEPGKRPKAITAPWRLNMIETLKAEPNKELYKRRKQTVEPVFGILKSVLGFTRFSLRGIEKVKAEW
ncbi:MAG: transposase [Paracoccus sp. (in: a-proteobacteria)]